MAQNIGLTEETKTETTQRSFYYYDIQPFKKNNAGSYEAEKNREEVLYKAFEHIEDLFCNNKQSELIVKIDNGDRVYVIPDEVKRGYPIKFRVVLVRTNGLPLVEQDGELISLTDFIDNDFGLAEITHCVIFPKYGALGAEYNYSGARPTAIKTYLPQIVQDIEYLYCVPHINQDVFQRLLDGEGLSLFKLEIRNTLETRQYIMGTKSIFLLPFTRIPDNDTYEVTIKRRKGKKKKGFNSPLSIEEMKGLIWNCGEDIKTFKVSQGAICKDAVDLLRQKVVHKTNVTKTANKNIDSADAYKIIIEFFNKELKGNIFKE